MFQWPTWKSLNWWACRQRWCSLMTTEKDRWAPPAEVTEITELLLPASALTDTTLICKLFKRWVSCGRVEIGGNGWVQWRNRHWLSWNHLTKCQESVKYIIQTRDKFEILLQNMPSPTLVTKRLVELAFNEEFDIWNSLENSGNSFHKKLSFSVSLNC